MRVEADPARRGALRGPCAARDLVLIVTLAGWPAAGACPPAVAAPAEDAKSAQEEPVRVEEEAETVRVEEEAARAPSDLTAFSTTIRAEELAGRITSVAELLQETVGLHVRAYGGLGSFATVSIRGSTAEQVNVYLDGVLLNPALGGGVNLGDLPLAGVESIEVYRGFTPAFLDPGAIGGAIHIRTRRPVPGGRLVAGSLSYGSLDTSEASALVSWSGDDDRRRAGGMVSASGSRSNGDFLFFDNNGTPFEGGDDRVTRRRNNRFDLADIATRAGFAAGEAGRVDLQASLTRRRSGVPGIDAFQSLDARSGTTRSAARAAYSNDRLLDGALSLHVAGDYGRTRQEFEDSAGDTTGGASTDTSVAMQAGGPTALLRWRPAAGGWRRHHGSLLASARLESAERSDRVHPDPDRGRALRLARGLSLEDEIHLAGGRLILVPSLRWLGLTSRFDAPESVRPPPALARSDSSLSRRLGAAWHAGGRLMVRANAGRFHRPPSFLEIFGDQGTLRGSDDLEAERGWNYDVGLSWEGRDPGPLRRLRLEIAAFRSDADNLIQLVQTSQSEVVPRNTGRARVTGLETTLDLDLPGGLAGGINYTWQVAEDRGDTFARGNDLPGRPRHELSARAGLDLAGGRWGRLHYSFDYIGPSFFDPAAAVLAGADRHAPRDLSRAPGRYLHGAGWRVPLGGRLELSAEVDNLFDVRTLDVARYPLPGRLVQARLRLELP